MVGAGEEFMVAAALYESKTKSQLLAKKAIICTYIEKHELVFCTLLSFLCPPDQMFVRTYFVKQSFLLKSEKLDLV